MLSRRNIYYKELLEIRKNMFMVIEDSVEELGARVKEILQNVKQTVEEKRKVGEN